MNQAMSNAMNDFAQVHADVTQITGTEAVVAMY